MSIFGDLYISWKWRNIGKGVKDNEYKLKWEQAEWETFFAPDGVEFPNGEKRGRWDPFRSEDLLSKERETADSKLGEASELEHDNRDSIEAKETLKRARENFFAADRALAELYAARAYHFGRMQNAKVNLEEKRDNLTERNEARHRLRRHLRLNRRVPRLHLPRLSHGE